MGKKKVDENEVQRTKLILKGNPYSYYKNQTIIDFRVCKKNSLYKKAMDNPIYPIFSNDCKYYTPSFILPKINDLKDQDCFKLHHQKVQDSLKEIEEESIMIPKPSSKSLFCGVCRTTYQDYLDHIQSPQHKQIISQAKYQKQIINLSQLFKQCFEHHADSEIYKKDSTQTKINQDSSYTQCFLQERKLIICSQNQL